MKKLLIAIILILTVCLVVLPIIYIENYEDSKLGKKEEIKESTNESTNENTNENTNEIIRVASLNMGYLNCGASSVECNPTWEDFRELFINNDIDIIGTQEGGLFPSYMTNASNEANLKNIFTETVPSRNSISSKYELKNRKVTKLTSCKEGRAILKAVIEINGVKVSFYNTHLGLSECNEKHFKDIANIIKKDRNPVILTGDFNRTTIDRYEKYLKPLGAVIASHDTLTNNLWNKENYCDMVVIIPKGHISILDSSTIETFGTLTDHNMVIAELSIY